jgi:hypothetical protein
MRISLSLYSVDGGGGMNGRSLPSFPSASVATSVLLTLGCVLNTTSTGNVLGVGPVPDTVFKKTDRVVSRCDLGHNVLTSGEYFFVDQRSPVLGQSADHQFVGGNRGGNFGEFRSQWYLRGIFVPCSPDQSLESLTDVHDTRTIGSNGEGRFLCSFQRVAFLCLFLLLFLFCFVFCCCCFEVVCIWLR